MSATEVVAARTEAVEIESAERGAADGDENAKKKKGLLGLNGYALAGAVLACTNSILLGYDIGVMSGALLFIETQMHLSNSRKELLVSALSSNPWMVGKATMRGGVGGGCRHPGDTCAWVYYVHYFVQMALKDPQGFICHFYNCTSRTL
uniref:Uncharacterized protein n=1 Tax=Kalanchoe fedtschenkoi TaxID=63787 RepID=A0A7N0TZ69_KALFE